MMQEQYLVVFDADRIKDYVFATGRLKEIRGASEQVRQIVDPEPIRRLARLANWEPGHSEGLIYAGGGAGALLFADHERAQTFCDALERTYRQRTYGASLTAVCVQVEGLDVQAQAEAQDQAARALARRKASRPQAQSIASGGVIRFCASDRLYPATSAVPEPGSSDILVSEFTALKRLRSRTYRSSLQRSPFWQLFEGSLPASDVALWRSAIHDSQDLGSIGVQAQPRGYVALVYADGDGIGKMVRETVLHYGFRGYQQFSQTLSWAAEQATAHALAEAYSQRPPSEQVDPETGRRYRALPFEIITIGGDDVVLICTGERGVAIACSLSQKFGTLLHERLARQKIVTSALPSASVGVVIAHDSLPISQLERRGRDLLNSAKTVAASGVGGIDFHIVSTPSLANIKDVRRREYTDPTERTMWTMRPYTCTAALTLIHHARHLRGLCDSAGKASHLLDRPNLPNLPGGKRTDLYQASRKSRVAATLDVLTIHSRLANRERQALLQALADLQSIKYYPFAAPDSEGFRTALPDLMELLEFVAEEAIWPI